MDRPSGTSGPFSPITPKDPRHGLVARRVRRPWQAILVSVVFHLVLAAGLLHFVRSRSVAPAANPAGAVELLMVEKRGEPAPPSQSANPTTPTPPRPPSPQVPPSPPTRSQPQPTARDETPPPPPAPEAASDQAGEKLPLPAQAAGQQPKVTEDQAPDATPAERREAKATEVPTQKVAPARPQEVPVFNLEGTDSESNAIVMGNQVIPASPDDRFRNRPPIYPNDAALRHEQGEVVLLIHVSASGASAGADVAITSGVASLDRAALDAVRRWHFRPAMKDGRSVPFDMPMRFIFEIN
jgi:periplasmic protein TonB